MNRLGVAALLSLLLPVMLQAQTEEASLPIRLGPSVNLNVSMNTNDYHVSGAERSVGFGSTFGLVADIPFSEDISFYGSLGYYTQSFEDVNELLDVNPNSDNDNANDIKFPSGATLTTTGSISYLGLGTMVKFTSFFIGFHWGIPMGATITNEASGISIPQKHGQLELKKDISPETSDLNFLIEARLGGDFPIMTTESAQLRFTISGSYPLTTIKDKPLNLLPRLDDNFRLPSLQAGVSYLFSL